MRPRVAATLGEGNAIAGVLDVGDAKAWERALEEFWQRSGRRLDVLLNNAGILATGPFEAVALDRHDAMLAVNVGGTIKGCHAAFPYLRLTPGARVINMASATAIYGQPELVTYSATKFAIRGFTEGLDLEWSRFGIRVCDVWPSFVKTNMAAKFEHIASARSLGIRLAPADVAATVWACADDAEIPPPNALDGRPAGRDAGSGDAHRAGCHQPAGGQETGTMTNFDFDWLVVGSGFGGSVSALRLSEKGYRVGVLERGRRYRDEELPESAWQFGKYLWSPRLGLRGIMRMSLFRHVFFPSQSAVGGGSTVYGGVLYRARQEFFSNVQWRGLGSWEQLLRPHYATAERMLAWRPSRSIRPTSSWRERWHATSAPRRRSGARADGRLLRRARQDRQRPLFRRRRGRTARVARAAAPAWSAAAWAP